MEPRDKSLYNATKKKFIKKSQNIVRIEVVYQFKLIKRVLKKNMEIKIRIQDIKIKIKDQQDGLERNGEIKEEQQAINIKMTYIDLLEE